MFSLGSGISAGPFITAPVRWLKRELCQMQTSELPDNSTGPPACVHTGLRATKFFSSIRVTNTEVVIPFLGNVAAVVAPIARVAVVRFFPATVSAFASAGGVGAVADADGDGELECLKCGKIKDIV